MRHGATIGVTEHQRFGTGLFGRMKDAQRKGFATTETVKEVFCVKEDALAVAGEKGNGVFHHGDGLIERRPQRFFDVTVP